MKKRQIKLLSLPQVAKRINISRQTAHTAVKDGRLKAQEATLGGRTIYLVTPSDADEFARSRKK